MQRVFMEDRGRYCAGDTRDYPVTTWKDFFPGYEDFTRAPDELLKESVEAQGFVEAKLTAPKANKRVSK